LTKKIEIYKSRSWIWNYWSTVRCNQLKSIQRRKKKLPVRYLFPQYKRDFINI